MYAFSQPLAFVVYLRFRPFHTHVLCTCLSLLCTSCTNTLQMPSTKIPTSATPKPAPSTRSGTVSTRSVPPSPASLAATRPTSQPSPTLSPPPT
jgi:hypothetical protein